MQPAGPSRRAARADLPRLGLSPVRRVLAQPEVGPVGVVVVDVLADHAAKLPLIDGDHVVEAIPPKAADPAFGIPVFAMATSGPCGFARDRAPRFDDGIRRRRSNHCRGAGIGPAARTRTPPPPAGPSTLRSGAWSR